jgi:hypothetical protein
VFGDADIIRGGVPLFAKDRRILGVVVVDYFVPKSITKRALQISQSFEQYKYLSFLKTPVKNSYILTLLLITLVIFCRLVRHLSPNHGADQNSPGDHEVAQEIGITRSNRRRREIGVLMTFQPDDRRSKADC